MERTLETLQEYLETDITINKDWLGSSDFLADVISKYMTGKELSEGQKTGVLNITDLFYFHPIFLWV